MAGHASTVKVWHKSDGTYATFTVHALHGSRRSTYVLFPLLHGARAPIVDTVLIDGMGVLDSWYFTSAGDKHASGVVLQRKADKVRVATLSTRFVEKSQARHTPNSAIQRLAKPVVHTRSTMALLMEQLQKRKAQLLAIAQDPDVHSLKAVTTGFAKWQLIQEYVPPKNDLRYIATFTRTLDKGASEFTSAPITVVVEPFRFSRTYKFQNGAQPPVSTFPTMSQATEDHLKAQTRLIAEHFERSQGMFMLELSLEFVQRQMKDGTGSAAAVQPAFVCVSAMGARWIQCDPLWTLSGRRDAAAKADGDDGMGGAAAGAGSTGGDSLEDKPAESPGPRGGGTDGHPSGSTRRVTLTPGKLRASSSAATTPAPAPLRSVRATAKGKGFDEPGVRLRPASAGAQRGGDLRQPVRRSGGRVVAWSEQRRLARESWAVSASPRRRHGASSRDSGRPSMVIVEAPNLGVTANGDEWNAEAYEEPEATDDTNPLPPSLHSGTLTGADIIAKAKMHALGDEAEELAADKNHYGSIATVRPCRDPATVGLAGEYRRVVDELKSCQTSIVKLIGMYRDADDDRVYTKQLNKELALQMKALNDRIVQMVEQTKLALREPEKRLALLEAELSKQKARAQRSEARLAVAEGEVAAMETQVNKIRGNLHRIQDKFGLKRSDGLGEAEEELAGTLDRASELAAERRMQEQNVAMQMQLRKVDKELKDEKTYRQLLFKVLADVNHPGVDKPRRLAGGYSSLPRPTATNVNLVVHALVTGDWKAVQEAASANDLAGTETVTNFEELRERGVAAPVDGSTGGGGEKRPSKRGGRRRGSRAGSVVSLSARSKASRS